MVAARLQTYAKAYLSTVPQYAYTEGRSLGQALERVIGTCAQVRQLLSEQACTLHARRQGQTSKVLCGGCILSLDISKAYDQVPWKDLELSLRDAQVPAYLIELIILIHHQTTLRIQHGGVVGSVQIRRGLRQGCGLAPVLWAIYSGWILKGLQGGGKLDVANTNTTYADDFLFSWIIRPGVDMENAYQAMKHILGGLLGRGLQLSLDKTVALIQLQGSQAVASLRRYCVDNPAGKGQCLRFQIEGQNLYVKIVTQHVYLGAIISLSLSSSNNPLNTGSAWPSKVYNRPNNTTYAAVAGNDCTDASAWS